MSQLPQRLNKSQGTELSQLLHTSSSDLSMSQLLQRLNKSQITELSQLLHDSGRSPSQPSEQNVGCR